jgi:hypothetical protein
MFRIMRRLDLVDQFHNQTPTNLPEPEAIDLTANDIYDWHTDMYSRFAIGEERARSAYEMPGTLEIPNTEDGRYSAAVFADQDLKGAGDHLAHVLDPETAEGLLADLGDDTNSVSGHWQDEEAGIAYLKIGSFMGKDTAEDLRQLMDKSFAGAKGFVLDLRSNPGGSVEEALQSSALFLSEGVLMHNRERVPNTASGGAFQYKERSGTFNLTADGIERPALPHENEDGKFVEDRNKFQDRTAGTPLTILADENTLSSAEILIAALRQNGEANAVIVGEQTGGKGTGQTVLIHPEAGSVGLVTSTEFYRPDGTWAGDFGQNRHGMMPDIHVPSDVTDLSEADIQYKAALQNLRSRIDS